MSNSNLYVTGLPEGLDEATFRQLFEGYGTIMSTKLFPEKRYGFVKFMTVEEAEYVAQNFNGQQVGDSQILVKIANNDSSGGGSKGKGKGPGKGGPGMPALGGGGMVGPKADQIYVTGLPVGLTTDELNMIFSNYGAIKWSKVLPHEGKKDAAAMVQMSTDAEAAWLVENLHGNIPQGLDGPVQVKLATPKSKGSGGKGDKGGYGPMGGGGMGMQPRPSPYGGGGGGKGMGMKFEEGDPSNLYVKGLPQTADELYLYKLFAPFGAIQSVKTVNQDWGAIGFVKYVQAHEAAVAIQTLSGQQTPEGSIINVSVKTSKGGAPQAFS